MAVKNVDEDPEVRIQTTQFEIKYYKAHSKQSQIQWFLVNSSKFHFSYIILHSWIYCYKSLDNDSDNDNIMIRVIWLHVSQSFAFKKDLCISPISFPHMSGGLYV